MCASYGADRRTKIIGRNAWASQWSGLSGEGKCLPIDALLRVQIWKSCSISLPVLKAQEFASGCRAGERPPSPPGPMLQSELRAGRGQGKMVRVPPRICREYWSTQFLTEPGAKLLRRRGGRRSHTRASSSESTSRTSARLATPSAASARMSAAVAILREGCFPKSPP